MAPLVAWTEIYSEIKGSVGSYKYFYERIPLAGLSEEHYTQQSRKKKAEKGFLTKLEKSSIYWIFLRYE